MQGKNLVKAKFRLNMDKECRPNVRGLPGHGHVPDGLFFTDRMKRFDL